MGCSGKALSGSKMEFQAATERSRGGELHWNLFALLGDAVAIISDVGSIEFNIQPARLSLPHVESGSKVGGEVLIQARSMLNDGAAAVAQCGSHPRVSPAAAIEEIRGGSVRLVKGGLNALTRLERLV